jgi:hypothetical protein
MRLKPAASNALIASCIRCSLDAPMITRVTVGDLGERFGGGVVRMLGAGEHRSERIR